MSIKTLALTILTAAALAFLVTGSGAWQVDEEDEGGIVQRAHRGLHSLLHSHHTAGDGRFGHGRGHHSRGNFDPEHVEEHLEMMLAHAEEILRPTPDQAYAWEELKAALRTRHTTLAHTMHGLHTEGATTASEHLAAVEQFLESSLEAVREVRPAFDAFYAALDEEQRQHVDSMLAHHRLGH